MNFKFPKFSKIPLSTIVPGASKEGITLIEDMLNWCPGKRPTAQQSLRSDIKIYCRINIKIFIDIKKSQSVIHKFYNYAFFKGIHIFKQAKNWVRIKQIYSKMRVLTLKS